MFIQTSKQPTSQLGEYTTITPEDVAPIISKTPEYIANLYSVASSAPKPTFNTRTPEYLKRAAKLNGYARAFSTLSDALTLGMGGTVKRREPDTKTPALLNNYYQYLDDFDKRKDEFANQEWMNKMRMVQTALSLSQREDDEALRNAKDNREYNFRVENANIDNKRMAGQLANQEKWNQENSDFRKDESKRQERQFNSEQTRLTNNQTYESKPFYTYDVEGGKKREYSEVGFRNIYSEALANAIEYKRITPENEPKDQFGRERLVDEYLKLTDEYEKKQASENLKPYVDKVVKNVTQGYTFPSKTQVPQYSTKGYY